MGSRGAGAVPGRDWLSNCSADRPWLWWTLYLACYVTEGWEPVLAGLNALRETILDVDLLMVVTAVGAAAIGQMMDGGLLIVIFATSGALEALTTARTESSVRAVLDLPPDTATRLTGDEATVKAAIWRSAMWSWSGLGNGSPPMAPSWRGE